MDKPKGDSCNLTISLFSIGIFPIIQEKKKFDDVNTYVRENCDCSGVFSPSVSWYLYNGDLHLEQAEWFHVGPCQDSQIRSWLSNPNIELIFMDIDCEVVELDDFDESLNENCSTANQNR